MIIFFSFPCSWSALSEEDIHLSSLSARLFYFVVVVNEPLEEGTLFWLASRACQKVLKTLICETCKGSTKSAWFLFYFPFPFTCRYLVSVFIFFLTNCHILEAIRRNEHLPPGNSSPTHLEKILHVMCGHSLSLPVSTTTTRLSLELLWEKLILVWNILMQI